MTEVTQQERNINHEQSISSNITVRTETTPGPKKDSYVTVTRPNFKAFICCLRHLRCIQLSAIRWA